MTRRDRRMALAAVATLVCVAGAAACHDTPASEPDAAVEDARSPDSRHPDARIDAGQDASPDATVDAEVIQHDFCGEPFFKLPIDGQTERTSSIEIDGHRLVWSKRNLSTPGSFGEVTLLDLETCVERKLTQGSHAAWVHLSGTHVVFDEFKDAGGPTCSDLYHHDLSTGITERLTETPGCELEPKSNGRYVVYRWQDTVIGPPTVSPTLRMLDMATSEDIELWPSAVSSYDVSDQYVVWVGYGTDPQSEGGDVYYHHLPSGVTNHVDHTYEDYQAWTFIWEDWVTIRGRTGSSSNPQSYLEVYNLVSNEIRILTELDYSVASAPINSGLAVWNTSRYTQFPQLLPADMDVYDIESGQSRRLTVVAGDTAPRGLAPPFLLVIRFLNLGSMYMNDFYIANLEALGVLDASGLLVPGDPVIDPP